MNLHSVVLSEYQETPCSMQASYLYVTAAGFDPATT